MKKKLLFELIWLVCVLAFSLVFAEFTTGNTASDINAHDTFSIGLTGSFLFSPYFYVASIFLAFAFLVYLIRALYTGFKVLLFNSCLLVSTGILLFSFGKVVSLFTLLRWTVKSIPSDNTPVKGLFYGGGFVNGYVLTVEIIHIALILIFAFTAFVIGKTGDPTQNEQNSTT
ncbi:MAG: hypothetical protein M3O71_13050 [Bacteroidota bacterium]|nr:hypothetical protein [Bacteroidota bacterium]